MSDTQIPDSLQLRRGQPQMLDLEQFPDLLDALARRDAELKEREIAALEREGRGERKEAALTWWTRYLCWMGATVLITAIWLILAAPNLAK